MTKHRRVTIFCSLILIAVSLQAQTLNWSLQQCIDSAIAYNLNIGLANNTIALNAVALKQSKNNLLPSINGNLGEELSVGRTVNATTGEYEPEYF
jgi:outer membrane protein